MADFSNLRIHEQSLPDQQVQDSLGDPSRRGTWSSSPPSMRRWSTRARSAIRRGQPDEPIRPAATADRHGPASQRHALEQLWQGLGFDANNYWQNQNFDRGVYNDTFAQNQQQFQNGLNLLGLQNSANQQNLGLGTTIQNTPLNYYGQFANQANAFGQGYGTQTGSMSAQGSPLMGAMGGMQLYNAWNNNGGWGWGGGGGGGNYGFSGAGTANMSGPSTNGNGGWAATDGAVYNNPSAYTR
jgi:hypothetical protein